MKKFISILCSVVLACVFLLSGCGGSAAPPTGTPSLRLRSEKEQALKVGEGITLVWTTANTEEGVTFSSSDPNVVTVDNYGSVEAVGTGGRHRQPRRRYDSLREGAFHGHAQLLHAGKRL